MWHGMMWWVLMSLVIWFVIRAQHGRRSRRTASTGNGRELAELRELVEHHREYIEQLETRLARVEDGLDFAERLLADRGAG